MLPPITWTHYLLVILLLVTAYYVFVGIRFYSHEIKSLLSGQFKARKELTSVRPDLPPSFEPQTDPDQMELSFADTTDETFEQVDELIEKIKAIIKEVATQEPGNDPLIASLGLVLRDYADLKGSHFQSAINELIRNECKKLGFPTLQEVEIERLWG